MKPRRRSARREGLAVGPTRPGLDRREGAGQVARPQQWWRDGGEAEQDARPDDAAQVSQRAVALRARMRRGLDLVTAATEASREVLVGWLDLLPLPRPGEPDPIDLLVRTDAGCGRLLWAASGPTRALADLTLDLFVALGVSSEECVRFRLALNQLCPASIGTWMELSESGFDGGWMVQAQLPLEHARVFAPMSEPHTVLSAWASRHGLDSCSLLSRSVGDGTPYTDLVLALPGPPAGQCGLADEAMAALGIAPLPEAARRAIEAERPRRLGLSVRMFDGGVAKVGVVIRRPSPAVLEALGALCRAPAAGAVAAFEGAIGGGAPRYAEFSLVATGFELELVYAP